MTGGRSQADAIIGCMKNSIAETVIEIGRLFKKNKIPIEGIHKLDKRLVVMFAYALKENLLDVQTVREIYAHILSEL